MFLLIDGVYEKIAQGLFWGKQGYGMTAKGHKVSVTSQKHCFYFRYSAQCEEYKS